MNAPSVDARQMIKQLHLKGRTGMLWLLKGLVRVYQVAVSPFVQPRCRYQPTCSHYAMQALEQHGVLKGFVLSAKRLGRCHPWSPGGVDLVPMANEKETSV